MSIDSVAVQNGVGEESSEMSYDSLENDVQLLGEGSTLANEQAHVDTSYLTKTPYHNISASKPAMTRSFVPRPMKPLKFDDKELRNSFKRN